MYDSGDYVKMGIDESEITRAIQEFDTEFDKAWLTGIDGLIRTYQEMQYELQKASVEPFKYKIVIAIDSKFNFRMVDYSTNLMGVAVKQTIYYDRFGFKADQGIAVDENKAMSIKKMIDDPQYADEMAIVLLEEGINKFMDGEALSYFMSDLESKASVLPANEASAIVDMVKYFTENKEMIKNMLLGNLGL